MKIPNFSYAKIIDTTKEKFGFPTDDFYYFLQQFMTVLQQNAGTEGLVAPTLSSASASITPPTAGGQITAIGSKSVNGTLLYDSNTDKLMVRLNDGTFHTVTTS